MRSVFKVLAFTALLTMSGSAVAQLSGTGMPSSTPGATTYGKVNQNQWAAPGSSSSTPGYTTYGLKTVPSSVGGATPYQLQPQGLPRTATMTNQQFLFNTPPVIGNPNPPQQ